MRTSIFQTNKLIVKIRITCSRHRHNTTGQLFLISLYQRILTTIKRNVAKYNAQTYYKKIILENIGKNKPTQRSGNTVVPGPKLLIYADNATGDFSPCVACRLCVEVIWIAVNDHRPVNNLFHRKPIRPD